MNRKLVSVTIAVLLTVSSLPVLADAQTSAHDSQGIIAVAGGTPTLDSLHMRKSGGDQQEYLLPAVSTEEPSPSIIAVL